jgi:hypothetical protein
MRNKSKVFTKALLCTTYGSLAWGFRANHTQKWSCPHEAKVLDEE